jgi:hypothetical protein
MLESIPLLVSNEENLELTKEIGMEENVKEIWGLDPDKSPSPDGFTIHFFCAC